MGIGITGIDTPLGEVSWKFTETGKSGIQELFFFLEAKRPLVNPVETGVKSWYEQSATEIKSKLTQLLSQYSFNAETVEIMRHMVNTYNTFLDDLDKVNEQGIIYKNSNGDWANASFSIAVKRFRGIFREKISWLSDKYQVEFIKKIPKKY